MVRFGGLLCLAGVVSGILFLALKVGGGIFLAEYLESSDFLEKHIERKVAEFQMYVTEHQLSARDTEELTRWVRENPLILLEVYRSNVLIYTSYAPENSDVEDNDLEAPYYDWESYYMIEFSDGPAEVVLYSGEAWRWFGSLTIASLAVSFLSFLAIFIYGSRELVRYICLLSDQIQAMEGGDLDQEILVKGDHELSKLARGLDSMRRSFKEQREREKELYRSNQTMITQMSHDLRTPLTAIQIYTDILRYRRFEGSGQADEYLNKIDAKIAQIKQISENIFEYSLISGDQQIILEAPATARDVFLDPLSETVGYLKRYGIALSLTSDWPEKRIRVYQPYIKRLLDNVTSNLIKYADPAVMVQAAVRQEGDQILLFFRNEVRPDASHEDSSGIGLSNMRTMMEKMGGKLTVEQKDRMFQVSLRFPVS